MESDGARERPGPDRWAAWLLGERHRNQEALRRLIQSSLAPIRDRLLANASIQAGDTVLDVGTGDGLVAFGALEHVGPHGRAIFSDVVQDLLEHARAVAADRGVIERCEFVLADAERLDPIPDGSVDVVTVRAVLICVDDKQHAFRAFHRVLRPGGRLSITEPINRWLYQDPDSLWGFDVSPIRAIADKVRAVFDPPGGSAMTGFDERDLLAFAAAAGFGDLHLELRVDLEPQRPRPWRAFIETTFSVAAPTISAAMDTTLTDDERVAFVEQLRPQVESGTGTFPMAIAYLWAVKL
jgi:SAM-dependent methyltransferase